MSVNCFGSIMSRIISCSATRTGHYLPDKMSTRIRELVQRAGLKGMVLHTLRHSNASQLLSERADLVVSKRLGMRTRRSRFRSTAMHSRRIMVAAAKIWHDAMADVIQVNRKQYPKSAQSRIAKGA